MEWSQAVFFSHFQAIITLILATDMARHGEILDSFKQKVDNFDFTNEEHVTCVHIHYGPIPFPMSTSTAFPTPLALGTESQGVVVKIFRYEIYES